jgi:SAM-dependent methyltransferase
MGPVRNAEVSRGIRLVAMEVLSSEPEELAVLARCLRAVAKERGHLEILEAGCGRRWPLQLGDVSYRLTGIDLDSEALRLRETVQRDLDEAIVGDICTADLPPGAFDVIYSSFVLEHIADAPRALANFSRWLARGGLLLLRIPDRSSAYGVITRLTPHWFHVAFYRYYLGNSLAGTPGHGPYPTHYHPIVSRPGLRRFGAHHGLSVLEECGVRSEFSGRDLRSGLARTAQRLVSIASLGQFAATHSNLLLVLKKAS